MKMNGRKLALYSLLILLTATLLLMSCSEPSQKAGQLDLSSVIEQPLASTPVTNGCIPPVVNLGFPINATPDPAIKPRVIYPMEGWQYRSAVPERTGDNKGLVLRNEYELWVKAGSSHKVFRYNIDTSVWNSYGTIGDIEAIPDYLFVSRDNTLWGFGVYPTNSSDHGRKFTFLSRYNEGKDRFEFVQDMNGAFESLSLNGSEMEEDQNGLLWIFMNDADHKTSLISFDPKTLKIERHFSGLSGGNYAGPAIAKDGSIWFTDPWKNQLNRYNPFTRTISSYQPEIAAFNSVSNIYFDNAGRLWMNDIGWLDFGNPTHPIWYQNIRSPVFIDNYASTERQYVWLSPSDMYPSSNGWLWFTASVGIVRLEPDTGEWCLFTTRRSPVVEDEQHTLWIVVYDYIYSYKLP